MLKLYLLLCYEFLQIGFFAVGGGYAALPFLFELQKNYGWFTVEELTDMIAVANITPGPVGINAATYAGFKTGGIIGSVVATVSIVLIPFIISIIISKAFEKYKNLKIVKDIFLGLRPAACALLISVAIKLLSGVLNVSFNTAIVPDFKALILFIILLTSFWFTKKNPLLSIVAGGLGGIILKCF